MSIWVDIDIYMQTATHQGWGRGMHEVRSWVCASETLRSATHRHWRRDPQPMVLAKAKVNYTVHLVHIWPYILLSFSISHVVFVCLMLSLYVQCLKYESKMYIVLFQYNHKLYTAYFAFFFLFCFLMADSVSLRISSA